jgi:D-aminopeptidase
MIAVLGGPCRRGHATQSATFREFLFGHETLRGEGVCSGVTAILPHGGDLFDRPVPAGLAVLNGFGKSAGLMQLEELGEIETPILLTNTFAVDPCSTALILG